MTTFLSVKNRAISTLAGGISDSDLSFSVAAGEGTKFPSTFPFHITIDNEILECTGRSTDVLTVTRAAESTSAASHSLGANVSLNITAQCVTELQTTVNGIGQGMSPGNSFFLGTGAGLSDDGTNNYNTGIGYYALNAVTSAGENTALGFNAAKTLTTGVLSGGQYGNNTAIGAYAFYTGNGSQNTAIGCRSMYYATSATENTAIGHMSLNQVTTGNHNCAIGHNALFFAQTPSWNTAVGSEAIMGNDSDKVTGVRNTAVGDVALVACTTGSENVCMGHCSLYTDTTGYCNVVIGTYAGYSGNGSFNIFIGQDAGFYETGDYKFIVNSIRTASEAEDETLSLLYGVMTGAIATQTLAINGNGESPRPFKFTGTVDSGAVADRVSLGGYDISAGHRALAISSEEVVVAGVAVTSTHKYPVRINGATYYILLSNV